MKLKAALIFYYHPLNRNSFNVLLGSLEEDAYFDNLDLYFIRKREEINEILEKNLSQYEKIIFAFSFSTPQVFEIEEILRKIKKDEKLILVAGGPHPSALPEKTLKIGFNYVVVGEGEETFSELIKAIDLNGKIGEIKGLAYFENKKYKFTGFRDPINLDEFPPFAVKNKKFNQIEITRGCVFACKFCQTSYLFGRQPRHRSIANIVKYVKIMKENGLRDIRFITPNALSYGSRTGREINLKAIEKLLKSVRGVIKNEGRIFFGTFPSEVRPEFVSQKTLGLIKKYCDNDNIIIGAQSGSERMLKMINRGHGVKEIYRAVELTLKNNLKANVDFIFGLPGENEKDKKQNFKVVEDLIKMGARIHAHTFIPLPGTPFYKAKPTLTKEEKIRLKQLSSQGKVYGDWEKQEKLAKKLCLI